MKKRRKYYIPVNGELYETSEIVYKTYYKMERRERYLIECSKKYELSFETLVEIDYPVEEKMVNKVNSIEEDVITSLLIEKTLSAISNLSEDEKWLFEELFFYGKSERKIANEFGIPRKTISYRKNKILGKIKKIIKK